MRKNFQLRNALFSIEKRINAHGIGINASLVCFMFG